MAASGSQFSNNLCRTYPELSRRHTLGVSHLGLCIIKTFLDERCAKSMGLGRFCRPRLLYVTRHYPWFSSVFCLRAPMRLSQPLSRLVPVLTAALNPWTQFRFGGTSSFNQSLRATVASQFHCSIASRFSWVKSNASKGIFPWTACGIGSENNIDGSVAISR